MAARKKRSARASRTPHQKHEPPQQLLSAEQLRFIAQVASKAASDAVAKCLASSPTSSASSSLPYPTDRPITMADIEAFREGMLRCYTQAAPTALADDPYKSLVYNDASYGLSIGDHVFVERSVYSHHGIYIGGGDVVEFDGGISGGSGKIRVVDMATFLSGGVLRTKAYEACLPPEAVVELAKSRIGQGDYSLFSNNCEHFATWCKTGRSHSEQVETAKEGVALTAELLQTFSTLTKVFSSD
jgi:hypothetical protein